MVPYRLILNELSIRELARYLTITLNDPETVELVDASTFDEATNIRDKLLNRIRWENSRIDLSDDDLREQFSTKTDEPSKLTTEPATLSEWMELQQADND